MPAADPELETGAVHIWQILPERFAYQIEHLTGALDAGERLRAASFAFEVDRAEYIVAHAALRGILSTYTGLAPAALRFGAYSNGKPHLLGAAHGGNRAPARRASAPLEFNLSHTRGIALCAVAAGRRVGVDIERITPVQSPRELVRQVFSSTESADWHRMPADQQLPAFYAVWTRKEALVKGLGEGLSAPLEALDVPVNPSFVEFHARMPHTDNEDSLWTVADLPASPGYRAAIAVEGPGLTMELWDWPGPGAAAG